MKPDPYRTNAYRARVLKVSESHLSRCIRGIRPWTRDLKMRYDDLVEEQRKSAEIDAEIKATKIPFPHYFVVCDVPEKVDEAVAEFGDACHIIGGRHIAMDASRIFFQRYEQGKRRVHKGGSDEEGKEITGRIWAYRPDPFPDESTPSGPDPSSKPAVPHPEA